MPFILRQVEPTYLSRGHADHLEAVVDDERQVIANLTLSGAIRQLASLVRLAAHIFGQLEQDGNLIQQRTLKLKQRIHALHTKVDKHDPRTVTVPEDDLETFSEHHKENHFRSQQQIEQLDKPVVLSFFTKNNRPEVVETLYAAAAPAVTVPVIRTDFEDSDLARLAALGATLRRRKPRVPVLDIETRRPASLAQLRSWLTDDEALDEVSSTVGPDNRAVSRATSDGALHRLPSPEEKARVAAQVFSAELVPLDTSGKSFQRMTQFRRSLTHVEYETQASGATRKRSSRRRHKKRRNTLASDDKREIQLVVEHCEKLTRDKKSRSGSRSSLRQRLNLVHLFRQSVLTTPSSKRSESAIASSDLSFEEGDTVTQTETDETSHASSSATPAPLQALDAATLRPRRLGPEHTFLSGGTVEVGVEVHRESPEENKRDSVYDVIPSEKEFGTLGAARPLFRGVKLRCGKDTDGARSSSGNWSGSSSTRASLDSENPSTGTNLSPPSIRHRLNRTLSNRSLDFDSALSDCSQSPAKASATGTRPLAATRTPIRRGWTTPEVPESHVMSDTETSSIYSCDAEGYYTSFHIDSGLKTLKEEAVTLRMTSQSSGGSTRSPRSTNNNSAAENEYELFGKGSTSTTTSSAGTVIMRERETPSGENKKPPPEPPPRNRDSVATVIHLNFDLEMNETRAAPKAAAEEEEEEQAHLKPEEPNPSPESDSESRMETETRETQDRIRIKTTINSSRIPALCVITPPPSDDDSAANSAGASSVLEAHIQAAFLQQITVVSQPAPPPPAPPPASSNPPPPESCASLPVQEAPRKVIKDTVKKNPTPRINLTDAVAAAPPPDMPIVIKGTVVKGNKDGDLVSLAELPKTELDPQPFASGSSGESSRSSSLERRRLRQGARVTLDSDGKVVYSSDSLKRRKGAHTTFEPGHNVKAVEAVDSRFPPPAASRSAEPKREVRPTQPPPYRPAPTVLRTQPDGSPSPSSPASPGGVFVSRSDSYRQANQDLLPFQRNHSYRQANVNPPPTSPGMSNSSSWGRPFTPDQRLQPLDSRSTGSGVYSRRISSPALHGGVNEAGGGIGVVAPRRVSSPALVSTLPRGVTLSSNTPTAYRSSPGGGVPVNPNLGGGGRSYGGPRVYLNQRTSPLVQSGSNSSLNSTGSGFDVSSASGTLPRGGVVRPPSHPKDRPSFFASGKRTVKIMNGSSSANDLRGNYTPTPTTPGYDDTVSPTPRLSSLPLATPGGGGHSTPFLRQDARYNSLPVRFKSDSSPGRRVRFHTEQQEQQQQPDFHQWLPRPTSANSGCSSATGRESPEEGGFLDYAPRRTSPTPSSSSCSLDVSFTSSLNDPAEAKPTRSGSRLSLDQIYSALHYRFRRNSDFSTPEPTPARSTTPDTQSARQRFSWSPESASSSSAATSAAPPPGSLLKHQTPMQDFKRKLLNYSKSPTPAARISAMELLKPGSPSLAAPAASNPPPASPRRSSRTNYISNRLLNRKYSSPRSDVLNSTIVEGRSEEELADSRPAPNPSAGRVTPLETTL